jgi:hypothetical protein
MAFKPFSEYSGVAFAASCRGVNPIAIMLLSPIMLSAGAAPRRAVTCPDVIDGSFRLAVHWTP